MKKILALVLALCMAFALCACGQQAAAPATPAAPATETTDAAEVQQILVSINNAQPPASFINDAGEIDGQNYEVMMLVDEMLPEYEFVWEAVDQDAMIMGLDSGKYAAAVGNFWWNEKRAAAYLFPEYPIAGGVEGIAVNKKYESDVQSLEDFAKAGLKLTPNEASGAMYDVFTKFNEENPEYPLALETGDVIAAGEQLKWVIEGRYDGAAMFASEFDELKDTVDANDELYFVPFYAVKTWVLYGKDQTALANAVDECMAKLLEDGTLGDISIKWFGYDVYKYQD